MEGNWELHLRGNLKGYEPWLERVCPASVKGKMKVHGLVENEELLSRIAEHDIGYAGELGVPASRNLTITNKLFQCLQAGLAVVASETAGQNEATKSAPAAVMLFAPGDFRSLRDRLREYLTEKDRIDRARSSAWEVGFNIKWEEESTRLLGSVGNGL